MRSPQIDRFFSVLARLVDRKLTALLSGDTAGAVLGAASVSEEVEFALPSARRAKKHWDKLENALAQAARLTATPVNYVVELGGHGPLRLPDHEKRSRLYGRFGRITVKVIDPMDWSVGKVMRFLDTDEQDLALVLRKRKVGPDSLNRVWTRAVLASPHSSDIGMFRRQAEYFIRHNGRRIWGRNFNPEKTIKAFNNAL